MIEDIYHANPYRLRKNSTDRKMSPEKNMNILTKEQAETLEFRSLTWPYTGIEKPMLEKVVADMKSGNIHHAVVRVVGGLEVWRG